MDEVGDMDLSATLVEDELAAEEETELEDADDDAAVDHAAGDLAVVSEDDACGPTTVPAPRGPLLEESAGMVRVSTLGGAKLMFGRSPGPPQPTSFPVNAAFKDVLERTVRLVENRAPGGFGQLRTLTSAGMFVDKPGMHGLGRACDWDAWTFSEVDIEPVRRDHASHSLAKRQRYWALAALCRSRSSYVLHAEFNSAHEDHIHQDNGGGSVAFDASSPSTVKLVQAVCNEIFGQTPPLRVDGVFGAKSKAAVDAAMRTVHLNGSIEDVSTFRKFLRRSGRLGFRLSL